MFGFGLEKVNEKRTKLFLLSKTTPLLSHSHLSRGHQAYSACLHVSGSLLHKGFSSFYRDIFWSLSRKTRPEKTIMTPSDTSPQTESCSFVKVTSEPSSQCLQGMLTVAWMNAYQVAGKEAGDIRSHSIPANVVLMTLCMMSHNSQQCLLRP